MMPARHGPRRGEPRPTAERFGENLRRCRHRVDLSQEELALRADLHRTEIGFLENGKRSPRIDTLVKLLGAMEAEAHELLAGIEWVPSATHGGQFYIRQR